MIVAVILAVIYTGFLAYHNASNGGPSLVWRNGGGVMVDPQHPLLIQELLQLSASAVDLQEGLWPLPLPPAGLVPALCQPHILTLSPVETKVCL